MKIYDVPTHVVPDVWEAAKSYLSSALDYHPFLDSSSLLVLLLSGRGQLMIGVDGKIVGAAVMERVEYPSGAIVGNIIAMGADPGSSKNYLDQAFEHCEKWCKAHGCDTIGLLGRRGWAKLVTRKGWMVQPGISAWRHLNDPASATTRPDSIPVSYSRQ